jgi:hypothetical protein
VPPARAVFSLAAFFGTFSRPPGGDIVRFSRDMEDQNDFARSAARAFKESVVTGGKGDKTSSPRSRFCICACPKTRWTFSRNGLVDRAWLISVGRSGPSLRP